MRSSLSAFNEVWQQQFRQSVLAQLAILPSHSRLWVACSGGLDSMLLLHVLAMLCPERVQAIYVNHQLQSASDSWADFVAHQCEKLSVAYVQCRVDVAQGNVEEQARIARYQAFQRYLATDDVLVLAHHQQDQAETVLLRLLSGSGVQGLQAMSHFEQRSFKHLVKQHFFIWRPLLPYCRQQLEAWATQLNLRYVHDPMNDDVHYDRVWCRQVLWRVLEQRFPRMQQALYRTSTLMSDAQQILNEVLSQDWAVCVDQNRLNLQQFNLLSSARQRQLLSVWIKGDAEYRPNLNHVEVVQKEVIEARDDAQAQFFYQGYYYVRFQQWLYRYSKQTYLGFQKIPEKWVFRVSDLKDLAVSCGQFEIYSQVEVGLDPRLLTEPLVIQSAQGQMKIRVLGRQGAKTVKKFAQAYKIAPWLRSQTQYLYYQDELLGVFFFAEQAQFVLCQSQYIQAHGWSFKVKSCVQTF